MKKLLLLSIITITLVASMTVHAQSRSLDLYPKTAIITSINEKTDTVQVYDGYYTWSFKGVEDWQMYDTVSMIMDGKCTKSVDDDTIVSMRSSSLKLVG